MPHVRHRFLGFADGVQFFFSFFFPPPATRFSTGGSRGRVVSKIIGRDSAQRDYLRDERSCSDHRAKCVL